MLDGLVLSIYVLPLPVALLFLILDHPQAFSKSETISKYEVGDTVAYNRGRWAKHFGLDQTVDAVVESVSTEDNGPPYTRPLYTVRWVSAWPHISLFGRATVYADQLSD